MADNTRLSKYGILLAAVVVAGAIVIWQSHTGSQPPTTIRVTVPSLSTDAQEGQVIFEANCAGCHGEDAAGSDQGPPLVHKIYEPSHHGDQSFLAAVRNGVRRHHWQYGNMPPQPGVSNRQVTQIVTYVRELQRANGIN